MPWKDAAKKRAQERRWKAANPGKVRGQERRQRMRRRAWLAELKLESGCVRCGARPEDPAELHFHHRDPVEKHPKIGEKGMARLTYSRSALTAEIDKCDVLCPACHTQAHRELKEIACP